MENAKEEMKDQEGAKEETKDQESAKEETKDQEGAKEETKDPVPDEKKEAEQTASKKEILKKGIKDGLVFIWKEKVYKKSLGMLIAVTLLIAINFCIYAYGYDSKTFPPFKWNFETFYGIQIAIYAIALIFSIVGMFLTTKEIKKGKTLSCGWAGILLVIIHIMNMLAAFGFLDIIIHELRKWEHFVDTLVKGLTGQL